MHGLRLRVRPWTTNAKPESPDLEEESRSSSRHGFSKHFSKLLTGVVESGESIQTSFRTSLVPESLYIPHANQFQVPAPFPQTVRKPLPRNSES